MLPRDYEEKRDFIRMLMECPVECVDLANDERFQAQTKDLSGKGVCLETTRRCPDGSLLEIRIEPENSVLPPLHALVEVVRVERDDHGGRFRLGAAIREIKS